MSPALPQLTGQQVIKALRRADFVHVSTRGSHAKLRHPDGRIVIVPLHRKPLARGTLSSILRQAGMSNDELQRLVSRRADFT
ncbi:MAG: type II toxin-antitoxin system HicA family toxin [Mycobacteriales bacterium]